MEYFSASKSNKEKLRTSGDNVRVIQKQPEKKQQRFFDCYKYFQSEEFEIDLFQ